MHPEGARPCRLAATPEGSNLEGQSLPPSGWEKRKGQPAYPGSSDPGAPGGSRIQKQGPGRRRDAVCHPWSSRTPHVPQAGAPTPYGVADCSRGSKTPGHLGHPFRTAPGGCQTRSPRGDPRWVEPRSDSVCPLRVGEKGIDGIAYPGSDDPGLKSATLRVVPESRNQGPGRRRDPVCHPPGGMERSRALTQGLEREAMRSNFLGSSLSGSLTTIQTSARTVAPANTSGEIR